jgi:putative ABC transport system permease protein
MRLALRELRRTPGRFAVVGGALTVLVLLLLFLGGLLDGLFLNSTGAIRAVGSDAVVFSDDARKSLIRSSVDTGVQAEVASVDGVQEVGGFGVALLGVQIPGEDDIANGAVAGYELASDALPEPPPPDQTYADRRLESSGAEIGDVVLVGPAEVPLEIIGWVEDTNYLLQGGLWVEPDTWRDVQNSNRPDAIVADDEFQVLVVRSEDGTDVSALIAAINATTGSTETVSEEDAVNAIPGITAQNATFTAVIGVTFFVAALIVALFFALITLERLGIYAVLKAIGAPSRTLVLGLLTQAVTIAVSAFVIGGLIALGLAQVIPPEVPVQFELSRAAFILVGVIVTAAIGGLVSLRRIVRIDPASAIGAGA